MVDNPQTKLSQAPGRGLCRFLKDRSGNVAILAAFAVVPVLGAVGVATDSARGYLVNNRLQEAIDIAALAAARDTDEATRQATMEQYFWANFPADYLGSTTGGPTLVPLPNDQIQVTASVTMPNTFLQVVGIDTTTIGASTVVQKELRGMELVLVMDNTGSMRHDGKMDAMKTAATGLIATLYGNETTIEDFWVGVVPYQATVNVGYSHTDWLDFGGMSPLHDYYLDPTGNDYIPHFLSYNDNEQSYFAPGGVSTNGGRVDMPTTFQSDMYRMFDIGHPDYDPIPQGWKGCVEARHEYGVDQTDTPPTYPNLLAPYYNASASDNEWCMYDDDDSYSYRGEYCDGQMTSPDGGPFEVLIRIDERNSTHLVRDALGPNRGCPQPILPLVDSRSTVEAAIDQMEPWRYGGTFGNLGLVWGWRVISPRWRGLWNGSAADLPLGYDTELMDKVVIMLTDGENRFSGDDYSSYGRPDENRFGVWDEEAELDRRMAATCEAMKNQGIILYTITFQLSDSATQDLYRDCATSPDHYFNSPSNAQLQTTFNIIADQLSNLRLAE